MKTILFTILALLAAAHALRVDPSIQIGMHNFTEILRGIFESWDIEHEEVKELIICVHSIEDIEVQVVEIIHEIKQINIRNLSKLAEIMVKLFGALQNVFKDLQPCIDSEGDIKKLLEKFIHLSHIEMLKRLLHNLLDNGHRVLDYLADAVDMIKAAEYYKFGFDVGEVIELLFLKTPGL